jgi:hypothetical protein
LVAGRVRAGVDGSVEIRAAVVLSGCACMVKLRVVVFQFLANIGIT